MLPLLKRSKFFNQVDIYSEQDIDIDLNFRELTINFNIDPLVRWYSHLTGCFPDLSKCYLVVLNHDKFKKLHSNYEKLKKTE